MEICCPDSSMHTSSMKSANQSSCPNNTKDGSAIFSSYKPGQLHVSWEKGWLVTDGNLSCFSSTRATIFWCSSFFADGLAKVSSTISKLDNCFTGPVLNSQLAPYEIQMSSHHPMHWQGNKLQSLGSALHFANVCQPQSLCTHLSFCTGVYTGKSIVIPTSCQCVYGLSVASYANFMQYIIIA